MEEGTFIDMESSDLLFNTFIIVLAVPCLFSKSALMGSLSHQAQIAWSLGER